MFWIIAPICLVNVCRVEPEMATIYANQQACEQGLADLTKRTKDMNGQCQKTDKIVLPNGSLMQNSILLDLPNGKLD
jgi:hypothetical protein